MSDAIQFVKVKQLKPLNDYVALMIDLPAGGLQLVDKESAAKIKNEGVIVGMGPDVGDSVELGDRVVVRKNTYNQVASEDESYKDKVLMMVHKVDLILKIPHPTPVKYVFE